MNESEPLYLEHLIAEKIGVSRDEVRNARKQVLKKETGWTQHGREVVLSQRGLRLVLSFLGETSDRPFDGVDFSSCLVAPPQKKEGAAEAGGTGDVEFDRTPVELTVKRVPVNKRLVFAANADGEEVTVRVPVNTNFRPKMKLRAFSIGDGRFQLLGRCPRFGGRY